MLSEKGKLCFGFWMFVHWVHFYKHNRLKQNLELCLYFGYDLNLVTFSCEKDLFISASMAAHAATHCKDLISHEEWIARFLSIRWMSISSDVKAHGERVTTLYNALLYYQRHLGIASA